MKVPGKGLTISGETYQSLRAGILGGEIPPGEKVRTQKLCQRFRVSLGAVREALSQLMAEGLVIAEAHRGYTVSPLSVDDLKDLTRLRMEIETLCLTWSMEAGQIEWESEVIAATHRLTKTYRVDDRSAVSPQWIAAHDAYHTALVSACGSPRLLQIRKQLYEQSERYRKMESALTPRERNPDDEHKRIADAVVARNVPLATRLMRAHIALTTQNIIKMMEKRVTKTARAPSAPAVSVRRTRPKARPTVRTTQRRTTNDRRPAPVRGAS